MLNPRTRGGVFILISAFFYGTYGVWSRLMASSFGEFSQAWTRGLLLLIVILLINFKFKLFKSIGKKDLPWFIIIALAGGLNQAPYFYGFKYLNIGTATLLFYASLVAGGYLIGAFVFKERFTKIKYISLGLAIIGMFIIYKLTLNPGQFWAAGLTIMAGIMGSIAAVLPKKLSGNYDEFQIMSGYFIIMIIANAFLAFIFHDPLPGAGQSIAWGAQICYAIALFLANWAVIEGFKHVEASTGSLIGLAEILFGITFGILFFGETIGMGTILGASLIITSSTLPNLNLGHNHP